MTTPYRAAHICAIRSPAERDPGSYDWKPVRHHFGIRSFGVNANLAVDAGDWVVEEHTETGTTVLALGGEPGVPFTVSPWELKYFDDE